MKTHKYSEWADSAGGPLLLASGFWCWLSILEWRS